MPVGQLHGQVAAIALRAAARHGFALGGGNALMAHGVVDRFTADVDLFTDEEASVTAAAESVEKALRGAGFGIERRDSAGQDWAGQDWPGGLGDIFDGLGDGLAEWIVTAPGGEQMMLQMAYFDRARRPVVMEIGPVLDLEDVVGGKACALVPLTELTVRGCRISGQQRGSIARFRGHGLGGRREGSGRAGCAARRGATGDGGSLGALSVV